MLTFLYVGHTKQDRRDSRKTLTTYNVDNVQTQGKRQTAKLSCSQIRPERAAAGPVNPITAGEGVGAGVLANGMSITCSLMNSLILQSPNSSVNQIERVDKRRSKPGPQKKGNRQKNYTHRSHSGLVMQLSISFVSCLMDLSQLEPANTYDKPFA